MNSQQPFRPLHGSERVQPINARKTGEVDHDRPLDLTIYVRPAESNSPATAPVFPHRNPSEYMKPEPSAQAVPNFAASEKDLQAVADYAKQSDLKVLEVSPEKRSVSVRGRIRDAAAAFGVEVGAWEHQGGRYRGRTGPVLIPAQLSGIVEAVFGFDNRPLGRPHIRRNQVGLISRRAAHTSYLPPELGPIYDFPNNTDGGGQTIAIMTFNGALGENDQSVQAVILRRC